MADNNSVANGEAWTATGAFENVSGANEYVIVPTSCNYGFVTSVSRAGNAVTAKATNASGEAHSCIITAYVIAYKNA